MTKSLLIPLNNVAGNGDFCAEVDVGDPPQRQHMLIDSGSSTFALSQSHYDGSKDGQLVPTSLFQHVKYGMGEWVGPVVKTQVQLGHGLHQIQVRDAYVAIAETQVVSTFAHANGILGLAYKGLNTAHDMRELAADLVGNFTNKESTFPWRPTWSQKAETEAEEFVSTILKQPKVPVTPLFDQLAAQDIIPNQFAFLVHRSSVYQWEPNLSEKQKMAHPLNRGLLALGKPYLHTHLHHHDFVRIPLVCDTYYNLELLSVQVEGCAPHTPPPFEINKGTPRHNSNSFVDSGASMMVLPEVLFKQVMTDLMNCVPHQASLLTQFINFSGKETGIDMTKLDISRWPNIVFTFAGQNSEPMSLLLTPHSYWQTHAPQFGQASFKLMTLPGWAAQTIIGLPLMCEYYTVFDRSAGELGEMAFSNPKVAPHRFAQALQKDWFAITSRCKHLLQPQR